MTAALENARILPDRLVAGVTGQGLEHGVDVLDSPFRIRNHHDLSRLLDCHRKPLMCNLRLLEFGNITPLGDKIYDVSGIVSDRLYGKVDTVRLSGRINMGRLEADKFSRCRSGNRLADFLAQVRVVVPPGGLPKIQTMHR